MRAIVLSAITSAVLFAQSTVYTIETFAGTAWTGDGRPAKDAVLVQPQAVTADTSGNLYVSDAADHRVRRISPSGVIDTIAGTGSAGFRGDGGPARSALLRSPYGLAADSFGNLFVADLGNARVRRIAADGSIQTYAGGGSQSVSAGSSVKATNARLIQPRDVAVDRAGNLFISDFAAHLVYQVTPDGLLRVVAGTGQAGSISSSTPAAGASLWHPAGLAADPYGTLYIADSGNGRVRRLASGWLSTVLDSAGKELEFLTPTGLACDGLGRLFVADSGARITAVFPSGAFTSLAIGGTAIALRNFSDLYTVSGRSLLRFIGTTSEVIAGPLSGAGAGDGFNRSEWRFTAPSAMARDQAGQLYIADTGNDRVRRVTHSGELQTVTTRVQSPAALAFDGQGRLHVADKTSGTVYRVDDWGTPHVVAQVESRAMKPAALAFDAQGNLFIADEGNNLIRKVAPNGAMTAVAGGGSQTNDGLALLQRLARPTGLQFDAQGDLWFTEAESGRLRKLSGGRVTTLSGPELKEPRGLRIASDGQILVAEAGAHRVIAVSSSGEWVPVAGTGDSGFSGDGEDALGAMLSRPADVLPMLDETVLVLDSGNNRVRRLRPSAVVETVVSPAAITMPPVDVLHGGTLRRDAVAPGQIVHIDGKALPPRPRVTFDLATANVLAESATRLTVLVPREMKPEVSEITVWAGDAVHAKAPVDIVRAAPAILTVENGGGQALATNEDGVRNGVTTPAARGSLVTLFLTGEGNVPDPVTADIGGYAAEVVWSGTAPGLPGVYQVNVRTPGGFSPSGVVPVVITVGGASTQSGVTIVSR